MQKIFVLFLFLFLALFGLASLFNTKTEVLDAITNEKINIAFNQDYSFTNIRNVVNAHFDNRVPYRIGLYDMISNFEWDYFGRSIKPNKAIKGKADWLYLGNDFGGVVSESAGLRHYSDKQLRIIKNNILLLKKSLKRSGIELVVVVPPNKHSVYPEYLPYEIFDDSKLDILDQQALPAFLNLKPALLNNKEMGQLYHKTNSHWNTHGAYFGYRAIINYLNKQVGFDLQALPFKHLDLYASPTNAEDISMMISVKVPEERIDGKVSPKNKLYGPVLSKKNPYFTQATDPNYERIHHNTKCNDACLDKVIFIRDSFGAELVDLLIYNTRQLNVLHTKELDLDYVINQQPDLLIYEVVERNLDFLLKVCSSVELKAALEASGE